MKKYIPMAKAPVVKAPVATRMKIPQTPPLEASIEPVLHQPSEEPSTMPAESPLEESVQPLAVVPPTQIEQVDTPVDESDTAETTNAMPDESPLPVAGEATVPSDETPVATDADKPTEISAPESNADADAAGAPALEIATDVEPVPDTSHRTPTQPTAIQPAEYVDPSKEHFNIQVGAFRVEAYAHDTMAKLVDKGYDPFIYEMTDARQRTWFLVRFGRFASREKAALSLDQFKQKENITAVITRSGKL